MCRLLAVILVLITIGCIKKTDFPKSTHCKRIGDRENSAEIDLTGQGIRFNNEVIKDEEDLDIIYRTLESPPSPRIFFLIDKDYLFYHLDTLIADIQKISSRLDYYIKVNKDTDSCFLKINFPMRNDIYNESDSIELYSDTLKDRFIFIENDSVNEISINGNSYTTSEAINFLNLSFDNDTSFRYRYYIKYNDSNTTEQIVELLNIYNDVIENQKRKFFNKYGVANEYFLKVNEEYEFKTKIGWNELIRIINIKTAHNNMQ